MVYMGEWEKKATVDELLDRALYEPLSCATMAPSTLSRQPWRFIIDGGTENVIQQESTPNSWAFKLTSSPRRLSNKNGKQMLPVFTERLYCFTGQSYNGDL